MRASDAVVPFGEWFPDLPPLNNPGLTEAKNVLPVDATYKPYLPINGNGDALAARPQGAMTAVDSSGNVFLYAGTEDYLYLRVSAGWSDRSWGSGAYNTSQFGYWQFTQFDNLAICTNYNSSPQCVTVGSASSFTTLALTGTAPVAKCVGVVGRFVVLGDTIPSGATPNVIQWCGIDSPRDWPTPGSATALSVQAGEQLFNSEWGPVTGIASGVSYGLVFQRQAIHRMTYVGGDIVFQFDTIERNRGLLFPNSLVQIGGLVYFASGDGFYVTNGIDVLPIGSKKVDNYFADTVDGGYKDRMRGAVDFANKCIYWIYPDTTSSTHRPNRVLVYNYEEKRWTRAEDAVECIISGLTTAITLDQLDGLFASIDVTNPSLDSDQWVGGNNTILGFDADNKLASFSGAAGTAVIDGTEAELHPGTVSRVQGVKPLVTGSSPELTVAIGTRSSLGSSVTYSTDRSPNSRTGFVDLRSESRYHRARVTIEGSFSEAIGIEYQAVGSGAS